MKSPSAVICREKPALSVYPYGSERDGWEEARDDVDVNSAQSNCTISHLEQAGKGGWMSKKLKPIITDTRHGQSY